MNVWTRIGLSCLSVLAAALAPIGVATAQIKVTSATPSSAYQGSVGLDVVVSGSGFDNSAKVQYFVSGTMESGGIRVNKVVVRNSRELVTTIDVADTANLANFDIEVTLDSGRKGKGTTLFLVKRRPDEEPPPPTYPPGRYWHAFTSNGGTSAATSRLYMFGGDGGQQLDWQTLGDLWVYTSAGSTGATWTYVPQGSIVPGPRKHFGWSCGGGICISSNGSNGLVVLKETWVFKESLQTWTQVNCGRRYVCPPARMFPTMAYDQSRGTHVLFGGSNGSTALNDTYTFSPGTMTWVNHGSGSVPSPRSRAAAAFVPALGRIVLFGGQQEWVRALDDMYFWSGSAWTPIQQVVDGTMTAVPSLHSHSVAWDPAANRLIVTGGLVDVSDTPNPTTYYVTFSNPGGGWRAAWTRAVGVGCQAAGGSSPDAVIHPQSRMAFDIPSGTQVYFGGIEAVNDLGPVAYDNTVECK